MKDRMLDFYTDTLRNDFAAFTHRAYIELEGNKPFQFNWHIDLLAERFESVRHRKITRLIVNLAPRHLKSFIGSVVFPAYLLGHEPHARILCISYGQDLADKFGSDCRNLMSSSFYQATFDTRFRPGNQAVADLETTAGGVRRARALTGAITGFGADYIIIDDPIKAGEIDSETRRTSVNDSFSPTIASRLENRKTSPIVLVMQRLHADDLTASVQKNERWDVVALPVIAEMDERYRISTPYGTRAVERKAGEALQPSRDSAEVWHQLRATNPYMFAAQFQQNPLPTARRILNPDWLLPYEESELQENFDRIIQSWDTASAEGETNSYSVCTTWGVKDRHFYLLHIFRDRILYDKLKAKAVELAGSKGATTIVIEAQATGVALLSDLKRMNLPVLAAPVTAESKPARLEAKLHMFAGGFVHVPRKEIDGLAAYIDELTRFPSCNFSDQVDSTTQALACLTNTGNDSVERQIEIMKVSWGDPEPNRVRLFVPEGSGTLIGIDGQYVPVPANRIIEVDWRTAGAFQQRIPGIKRL